jgi:hypothetical protein
MGRGSGTFRESVAAPLLRARRVLSEGHDTAVRLTRSLITFSLPPLYPCRLCVIGAWT